MMVTIQTEIPPTIQRSFNEPYTSIEVVKTATVIDNGDGNINDTGDVIEYTITVKIQVMLLLTNVSISDTLKMEMVST